MEVEQQRLENLKRKEKLLADLRLSTIPLEKSRRSRLAPPKKKRRPNHDDQPIRSSARIAASDLKPSYKEEPDERPNLGKAGVKREPAGDLRNIIPSTDAEQIRAGWTKWTPAGQAPSRDDENTLHFDDYPDFQPNKSPEEILREGCFGGSYWRPLKSRKLGILIEGDWGELPEGWHAGLDVAKFLTNPIYDADVNKYKVSCGQSIEEWEANGWIAHEHDIRGWFQWYCRFFQGRRCDDDERQISRWKKCVGETGRWRRSLLKKYVQMGVREVFDDGSDEKEVSPVIHQTCHHWAYEVRQPDLDKAWAGR